MAPRRHHFPSSLTPLTRHHSTRQTLRVDLAQMGAAPIRLSNTSTMRSMIQGLGSLRIPVLSQQAEINSTVLLDRLKSVPLLQQARRIDFRDSPPRSRL